jgi:hypothetical protein
LLFVPLGGLEVLLLLLKLHLVPTEGDFGDFALHLLDPPLEALPLLSQRLLVDPLQLAQVHLHLSDLLFKCPSLLFLTVVLMLDILQEALLAVQLSVQLIVLAEQLLLLLQ